MDLLKVALTITFFLVLVGLGLTQVAQFEYFARDVYEEEHKADTTVQQAGILISLAYADEIIEETTTEDTKTEGTDEDIVVEDTGTQEEGFIAETRGFFETIGFVDEIWGAITGAIDQITDIFNTVVISIQRINSVLESIPVVGEFFKWVFDTLIVLMPVIIILGVLERFL